MRLQMLVPDDDVVVIRKLDSQVKEHFVKKMEKFQKESAAKMLLAAQKNDQRAIEKHNKLVADLETQRLHLFHNNIVRAAIAIGLKELEKLGPEKVLEASVKHGVARGRPNAA